MILLRLAAHNLSIGYLENGAPCFIKAIEYDNISFDCKVVEDEDGEEDGKEIVTNSEEDASKKQAWYKPKKDVAQALLLIVMPGLSVFAFASVSVLRLSVAMPGLSAAMLGLSTIVPEFATDVLRLSTTLLRLSIAVSGLSAAISKLSIFVLRLSAPMSASVLMFGLSVSFPLFGSIPLFLRSSPLLFLALSLLKIPMPNLAAKRRKLDNTICGWSGKKKDSFKRVVEWKN